MDFYRINEEYIKFLQKYEKEKEELQRYPILDMRNGISLRLVQLCE
jgi:hypothetical protein